MSTPSAMRRTTPEAAPGKHREEQSQQHPTQYALRFPDVDQRQRHQDVAMLRDTFRRAVAAFGGEENLALALGKPLSYASKISEAINGVKDRHVQFEEWFPALFGNWRAMEIILVALCDRTNREHPKAKRVATDAERAAALVKVLGKAGAAGEALLKAAADEMGVDVAGLVR